MLIYLLSTNLLLPSKIMLYMCSMCYTEYTLIIQDTDFSEQRSVYLNTWSQCAVIPLLHIDPQVTVTVTSFNPGFSQQSYNNMGLNWWACRKSGSFCCCWKSHGYSDSGSSYCLYANQSVLVWREMKKQDYAMSGRTNLK